MMQEKDKKRLYKSWIRHNFMPNPTFLYDFYGIRINRLDFKRNFYYYNHWDYINIRRV